MLPRSHRLCRSASIRWTLNQGTRWSGSFFSLVSTFKSKGGDLQVAFIASKKLDKRAVVRNRIRRKVRETIRRTLKANPDFGALPYQVVCLLRFSSLVAAPEALQKEVTQFFEALLQNHQAQQEPEAESC
jgi:ribonuclease P protein component